MSQMRNKNAERGLVSSRSTREKEETKKLRVAN